MIFWEALFQQPHIHWKEWMKNHFHNHTGMIEEKHMYFIILPFSDFSVQITADFALEKRKK